MTQIWHTVPALFLALVTPALAADSTAPAIAVIDGRQVAVADGDSLIVDGAEWRLMGYDTPETDRARCEGERRLGLVAKRRLEQLLRQAVERQLPVALTDSGRRDKYKRPLGDLEIAGRNVREVMIAEDLARPYNGGLKKGWCSRDSRDDLIPGPAPSREQTRRPAAGY